MDFLGHLQSCLGEKGSRTQKLWEEAPELPLWEASPALQAGQGSAPGRKPVLAGAKVSPPIGQKEARLSAGAISLIKCLYA